ncbi:hypothetical protein ILUMI_18816 [Ignelater luminosus]|uniref:Reverse transcriptase n=1 Tax=Ignelater luminosus TaxID=2038154 RepID=A0A8K0CLD0_IGNLU|nr:hypothetical protein ILUMI_18816 [Ignelater luminosus]
MPFGLHNDPETSQKVVDIVFDPGKELKYLGYVMDELGLKVDPDKANSILNTPISEVRRLIGLASWYRRFAPGFSKRIAPLTKDGIGMMRQKKPSLI